MHELLNIFYHVLVSLLLPLCSLGSHSAASQLTLEANEMCFRPQSVVPSRLAHKRVKASRGSALLDRVHCLCRVLDVFARLNLKGKWIEQSSAFARFLSHFERVSFLLTAKLN